MTGSDGEDPEAAVREQDAGPQSERRGVRSRVSAWVLLDGDRTVIATAILSAVFAVLVVLGVVDPIPLRESVTGKDPIETVFQALVTAIVTGVTLVLTINQLVLAQELGTVGEKRDRMAAAMAFRDDTADIIADDTSPPDPGSFLAVLVEGVQSRADTLQRTAQSEPAAVRSEIDSYLDSLNEDAGPVADRLAQAQFGTFDVVRAALGFAYSVQIYEARRIENEYADSLDEDTSGALSDLVDALAMFGPAREHFKTLYFQWELIELSRTILYAAVPALVVTIAMILFLDDPGTVVGTTLGVDNLLWLTSGAVTVAVAPFVFLIAYILRIVTVAKRTLAIGPFVLQQTEYSGRTD